MTQFVCTGCGYPSRSGAEPCDNPACLENPSISEDQKDRMRARWKQIQEDRAKDAARLADKERLRKGGFTVF